MQDRGGGWTARSGILMGDRVNENFSLSLAETAGQGREGEANKSPLAETGG